MSEDAYIVISDLDGSSNPRRFLLDEDRDGVSYRIVQSGQVEEHEFTFEGSMGETICRHPRQCPDFFFTQFETSDGTLRLPPAVTNVSSLDIAYTPITMWEDFDSNGLRAFYVEYRDTTTTPDIIIKKYDVRDNSLVDTEVSTTQGGAATETAPRIGKVASFEGNTFVPAGEESGSNHIRKIAVGNIDTPTADTYTEGDHFTSSHSVIEEDGVAKFVKLDGNVFKTAATTPETIANFSGVFEVGDSGTSIVWSLELGGFVYACTPVNLYELDPTSARPLLDIQADRKNKPFQTYDDFDGHMSATAGATVFYNHRSGFHRFRSGKALNLSIDNIPGYRETSGVFDDPIIGLRHYATDAVGQWVYSIYKPEGFGNTANCNIMVAFYQPGAVKELTWRTLISRNEDLLGLKIDSDKRLWFVQNPNDPAVAAGTVTFVATGSGTSSGTSITLSHTIASGSQRALVVGVSTQDQGFIGWPVSVKYGDQDMTLQATELRGNMRASLFKLAAPLVGTADIVAVFGHSMDGIVMGATNWTGVYQSEVLRNSASANGSSTTPSVTVSSATNDVVVDCVAVLEGSASTATVGSGQTQRWNANAGTAVKGAGSHEAGAASVVMDWSLDASKAWATVGASLRPGALGAANADLNYIQLNRDGSPRTALGRNRGEASATYEHYTGEIRFDRRVQARYIRIENENFDSTTSLQAKIHRDGSSVGDSVGSAITSDDFHQLDLTVGTTDLLRRGRLRLTLDTNGSYAPTVSDPRVLRAVLGVRSPDTYRAIMETGHSIDSARTERKILRQRKGAGTVQITESWSGTQFRADVVSIRDLETRRDEGDKMIYRTEILFQRHDVEV